ncbi:MAG: hypothetical protein WHS65_10135 [Melioribacteraceae bacterium]
MKGNEKINITKHAINQYRERIVNNNNLNTEYIEQTIKQIFRDAHYISDNEKGVLFRNEDLMIEFIVKDRKIITLYTIKRRNNNGTNGKNNRQSSIRYN